jgi:hypothetical protein
MMRELASLNGERKMSIRTKSAFAAMVLTVSSAAAGFSGGFEWLSFFW